MKILAATEETMQLRPVLLQHDYIQQRVYDQTPKSGYGNATSSTR